MSGRPDGITRCLEGQTAAWFGGEGRRVAADRVRLRQMNMAIALAVSRWLELEEGEDALARMRAWLDEVEERAVRRDAVARADAFRRVRAWLAGCS
ncbi:MAG: hypothetical protein ACRDNG_03790 [Gaiellaceae bacterium]